MARWERGDHVRVETLLASRSDLADNNEAILDLLYAEVLLAEEHGESPVLEEYIQAFSASRRALEPARFQVHKAFASLETANSMCQATTPSRRTIVAAGSPPRLR